MRIFDSGDGWGSKTNFVDKLNTFVGFDTNQSCCEHADYFFSKKEVLNPYRKNYEFRKRVVPKNLDRYVFDIKYFVEVEHPKDKDGWRVLDEGKMVRFRLKARGLPDLYLHLFNSHNGYYGHGFEAKVGDQKWQSGCL